MSNQSKDTRPLFAAALGENWHKLAPLVQQHYDLRPWRNERIVLQGLMEVSYPLYALPLLAVARVFGALVLVRSKNIKVDVVNYTRSDSPSLFWHRSFHLPNKKTVTFKSRMDILGPGKVVETVGPGLGVIMDVFEQDGALVYKSCGYRLKVGAIKMPLPGQWLLGKAGIVERAKPAVDKGNSLNLIFTMDHALLRRIFSYCGDFGLLSENEP